MQAGSRSFSHLVVQRGPQLILAVLFTILLAPSGADKELVETLRSAEIAVQAGQPEPALQALESALERRPDLHQLLPLAAEAALRSGKTDQAMTYLVLMDTSRIDPETTSCHWARVHLQVGNLEAARTSLQGAPACPLALAELRAAALHAFDRGEWARAETSALVALENGSTAPELEFLLIQLEAARQPRAALGPLRDFIDTLEEPGPLASDLLEALRTSLASPNQAFRLATVGQVFARHGEWHLASLAFQNAVALDPTYTQARAYYGLALERTGQGGREELLEAFRRDPTHPLPLAFLGTLFLEQGQSGQSSAMFQRAHEADPQDPALLVQLAAAQASGGNLSAAEESLVEAVSLAPFEPNLWLALAQFSVQWEIKLQELAIPAARRALVLHPGSAQAADLLGYAHLLRGRPTVSRRLLQRAILYDPMLTSAWYHLGLANLELGDSDRARAALEYVQTIEPDGPTSELARRLLARLP